MDSSNSSILDGVNILKIKTIRIHKDPLNIHLEARDIVTPVHSNDSGVEFKMVSISWG